jgi:poly-beta-1,6-N-acetyl-D-glucosamine synthase
MITFLFYLSVFLIVFTYIGYPLLIHFIARVANRPVSSEPYPTPQLLPTISVVMVVYNEQSRIEKKILNLCSLDYPANKLQIIVVSDGSTDQTDSIVQGDPKVTLVKAKTRSGKSAGLNLGVDRATGELIFFCDVRQEISDSSLMELVKHFQNPKIGAVSGELVMRTASSSTGQSVSAYWKYEKWIRKNEARFDSTVGLTGAIYMIRRADYPGLNSDVILDDFEIPMSIARKGKRVIFEEKATAYDDVQENVQIEAKRKLRTLEGNFQSMANQPWIFNPMTNRLWLQYMSHKFMRLVAPYFLILCFACSLFSDNKFVHYMIIPQLLLYFLALAARLSPYIRRFKLASLCHVFVELNITAVQALYAYWFRPSTGAWEKT